MPRLTDESIEADEAYDGAYRVQRCGAVAWRVLGWEREPVQPYWCPCGFSGYEREHGGGRVTSKGRSSCQHTKLAYEYECDYIRTGMLVCVMVGDDGRHLYDPSEVSPIPRSSYCGECGQIGCHCDGYSDE